MVGLATLMREKSFVGIVRELIMKLTSAQNCQNRRTPGAREPVCHVEITNDSPFQHSRLHNISLINMTLTSQHPLKILSLSLYALYSDPSHPQVLLVSTVRLSMTEQSISCSGFPGATG